MPVGRSYVPSHRVRHAILGVSYEYVVLKCETFQQFVALRQIEVHIAILLEGDCFDVPNLVDFFQQLKIRALALDLGEDQIGKEIEPMAFEEQYTPMGLLSYELGQLRSEC